MKRDLPLRAYLVVSGAAFLLVGLFHLLRLVWHWPVIVAATPIPHSLSYVGFPVATTYALWAFWLLRRKAPRT